jgi:hypothetical protein
MLAATLDSALSIAGWSRSRRVDTAEFESRLEAAGYNVCDAARFALRSFDGLTIAGRDGGNPNNTRRIVLGSACIDAQLGEVMARDVGLRSVALARSTAVSGSQPLDAVFLAEYLGTIVTAIGVLVVGAGRRQQVIEYIFACENGEFATCEYALWADREGVTRHVLDTLELNQKKARLGFSDHVAQ